MPAKLQIMSMAIGALLIATAVGVGVTHKANAQPVASNPVAQPLVSVPTEYLPAQFDMKKAPLVQHTVESF